MKSIFLFWALMVCATAVMAQSAPSVRVQQAFSHEEIQAMNESRLATWSFRAEKLCWFEQLKSNVEQQWYTLVDREGNPVVLTDAMVADFNPLLYNLPQQSNRCENLPVQTSSGNAYLLIVRSEEMMQKEWQRRSIKNSKTSAK